MFRVIGLLMKFTHGFSLGQGAKKSASCVSQPKNRKLRCNETWKYCCLYRLLVKIKFWVYYSEIFSGFSGPQVKCRISTMAWLPPASSTLLSLSSSHTGLLPMGPPRPKAFLPRGYLLHLDQSHPKLLPGCHLFTFQVCQTNCPLFPQTRSC